MTTKKPTSFIISIVVITITAFVFLAVTLFSYYQVDKKYAMILAFFMFIALAFTPVGIYTGLKYKSDTRKFKIQNTIGIIGNLLIFLLTIYLMAYGALMAVN